MISTEDFERLVRFAAGECERREREQIEADLEARPELRAALNQLGRLDDALDDLDAPALDDSQVDALVERALRANEKPPERHLRLVAAPSDSPEHVFGAESTGGAHRGPRRLVAVGVLLAASLVIWAGTSLFRSRSFVVDQGAVRVAGVTRFAGERVSSGDVLFALESSEVRQGRTTLVLAADASVALHADAVEVSSGRVAVSGDEVAVVVRGQRFVVDGEALFSTEPLAPDFRVTRHLTRESIMKIRPSLVTGVGVAFAVYVLLGHVRTPQGNALAAGSTQVVDQADAAVPPLRALPLEPTVDAGFVASPLRVRVVSAGRAVAHASVWVSHREDWSVSTGYTFGEASRAFTNEKGIALFDASPGQWLISAQAERTARTAKSVVWPAGVSHFEVDVELDPGSQVEGVTEDIRAAGPVTPATITFHLKNTSSEHDVVVETDALGRFVATGLASGEWVVKGVAEGYGEASATLPVPSTMPLRLVFHRGGFVQGYIHLPDAGAAAGADVLLVGSSILSTQTSASGAFALEAPAGVWQVQAKLGGLQGSSGTVVVHAGNTEQADLTLKAPARLHGRVVSGHQGVVGGIVEVFPHTGEGVVAHAETDANGYFELDLAQGTFDVSARTARLAAVRVEGLQVTGTSELTIELPVAGSIEGDVVVAGASAEGMTLTARHISRVSPITLTLPASGHFRIDDVEPGNVIVAIREGGLELAAKSVAVKANETTQVTLSMEPLAEVSLSVREQCSARPASAVLHVLPQNIVSGMHGLEVVVPIGELRTFKWAPGSYRVSAESEQQRCRGQSTVTVTQGAVSQGEIVLKDAAAGLSVTVVDEAGDPVADASVVMIDGDGLPVWESWLTAGATDARGVAGLEPKRAPKNSTFSLYVAGNRVRGQLVAQSAQKNDPLRVVAHPMTPLEVVVQGVRPGERIEVALSGPGDLFEMAAQFRDIVTATDSRVRFEAAPAELVNIRVTAGARVAHIEADARAGSVQVALPSAPAEP